VADVQKLFIAQRPKSLPDCKAEPGAANPRKKNPP
jgi:hypothetical protein